MEVKLHVLLIFVLDGDGSWLHTFLIHLYSAILAMV